MMPADDLTSLIAWLKARPGEATMGTAGAGGPGHIGGVLFQHTTGTPFQFVPYRGGSTVMQDLVAGQIDFIFNDPTTSLPQVHAGTIKAWPLWTIIV
jgi:tripartite-type tricarboxylate transporter receptor subunit TctC